MAFGLFHEAVNLAQSQTGTFARLFGREKRLECTVYCLSRHPRAAVGDSNKNVLAGRNAIVVAAIFIVEIGIARFDRKFAAIRHRITCVQGEIEQG